MSLQLEFVPGPSALFQQTIALPFQASFYIIIFSIQRVKKVLQDNVKLLFLRLQIMLLILSGEKTLETLTLLHILPIACQNLSLSASAMRTVVLNRNLHQINLL